MNGLQEYVRRLIAFEGEIVRYSDLSKINTYYHTLFSCFSLFCRTCVPLNKYS